MPTANKLDEGFCSRLPSSTEGITANAINAAAVSQIPSLSKAVFLNEMVRMTPYVSTGGKPLLDGINRRAERLRYNFPESNFVQFRNLDVGARNHFGLVNREISNCNALDHVSVAGHIALRPGLIVICPRGYGFSVL